MAKQRDNQSSQAAESSKKPDSARDNSPAQAEQSQAAPALAGLGSEMGVDAHAAQLADPRVPTVQRQELAGHLGKTLGNQYLQRMVSSTRVQRQAAPPTTEATLNIESAVAYNRGRFPQYNQALVDQLHQVANDQTLYDAATSSQEVGADFARLVQAAQRVLFTEATDQDGKLGAGTLRAVRQQVGVASTPAGLEEDGVAFAEGQVTRANYERFQSDRGGDFTVTGGFMEPHGHSRKGETQAVFSSDPENATTLPASDRNLGVDYVVHDEGKPANVWYGGLVTQAGLDGGYGNRVTVETDVTFMYQGREYTVIQAYAHLARVDAELGQIVNAGESVGKMGGTGSGGAVRYAEHIDLRTWITVDGQRIDISPNVLDRQLTERAAEEGGTEPRPAPEGANTEGGGEGGTQAEAETGTTPALSPDLQAVLRGEKALRRKDRGEAVREMQEMLVAAGYSVGANGPDAIFGGDTEAAVKSFQRANGLGDDGVVGKDTLGKLASSGQATPAPAPETTPEAGGETTPEAGGETTTEPGGEAPAPQTGSLPAIPPLVREMIKFVEPFEGRHDKTYLDSKGIPTVGIGFNLQRPDARERMTAVGANYDRILAGQDRLTAEQIDSLLAHDMENFIEDARGIVDNFDSLPKIAQMVIADMTFNMGPNRFGGFKKAIAAFEINDYATAADEMQDSAWYTDVGDRSVHHVSAIRYLAQTDTAEEAQTTTFFDVDAAVAYNARTGVEYNQALVDQMYQITGNEHLYNAATTAAAVGPEFARLVFAAQQVVMRTVAEHDGKLGPGSRRAIEGWANRE